MSGMALCDVRTNQECGTECGYAATGPDAVLSRREAGTRVLCETTYGPMRCTGTDIAYRATSPEFKFHFKHAFGRGWAGVETLTPKP
eukprot:3005785-Rhodomonas_salina.1